MERWWRGRVTGPDAVTKATGARDFACPRSALSRAVEWRLIETNPLMGMRQRSAASRKVVWFLPPDEEVMLRAALAARSNRQGTTRTSPCSQLPVAFCTRNRAIAGSSPSTAHCPSIRPDCFIQLLVSEKRHAPHSLLRHLRHHMSSTPKHRRTRVFSCRPRHLLRMQQFVPLLSMHPSLSDFSH